MPRAPRLDGPGVLHPVIARGIERRRILRTDHDRADRLARLATGCRLGGASLLAWALLPNHLHALRRAGPVRLSRLLQRVLGGDAREFNRRHRRHGHPFQNRFKSIVVEDDPYLLELVRDIHLTPRRAGLVADGAALDRYPWCDHSRRVGVMPDGGQAVDEVLQRFGGQVGTAQRAYRSFVEAGVGQGRRPELTGGGLRRSRGDCAVVAALERGRERWAFDERVLGSSDFVRRRQTEELAARQAVRPPQPGHEIRPRLVVAVAAHTGLSAAELCSGSKRREVVRARARLSFLAIKEAGVPTAAAARAMNLTPRAVVRVLAIGASVADAVRLHFHQIE